MKMRIMINKPEKLALIAHLEFLRMFERALRRAKLPVSLTQGFNKHYKITYLNALPVGESSAGEPVDIDFNCDVTAEQLREKLDLSLPDGFCISSACVLGAGAKSLSTLEQKVDYRMEIATPEAGGIARLEAAALEIIKAETYVRSFERKKGLRDFDLAKLLSDFRVLSKTDKSMVIEFSLTNEGSIMLKPRELMGNLREEAGIPTLVEIISVHRKKTWFKIGDAYKDAMELC